MMDLILMMGFVITGTTVSSILVGPSGVSTQKYPHTHSLIS